MQSLGRNPKMTKYMNLDRRFEKLKPFVEFGSQDKFSELRPPPGVKFTRGGYSKSGGRLNCGQSIQRSRMSHGAFVPSRHELPMEPAVLDITSTEQPRVDFVNSEIRL